MKEKEKWLQKVLSHEEREIVRKGGWGETRGFGARPCLMIIDAQYNYVGSDGPILDQISKWPSGCGETAWATVPKISSLIETARSNEYPVIFTRQVQKNISIREKFDSFGTKIKRRNQDMVDGARGTEIVEMLSPKAEDLVLDKSYASAFFSTPLISFLIKLQIDTILITGGTTSGCVRSTAVDAAARNYNVGIVVDCVFDRIEYTHRAALLDMWMKYADIITSEEVLAYFKDCRSFDKKY